MPKHCIWTSKKERCFGKAWGHQLFLTGQATVTAKGVESTQIYTENKKDIWTFKTEIKNTLGSVSF